MIRILFMSSNPTSADQLGFGEELRKIKLEVNRARFGQTFDFIPETACRTSDIKVLLQSCSPHIVHFSGHGSHHGELIFQDENGASKAVPPDAFTDLFGLLKGNIRCVMLNACFSRLQAEAISKSIGCVIGMSRSVSDEAAILFGSTFYQALAFGQSIQKAFELGCSQITSEGLDQGDIPQIIAAPGVDPASIYFADGSMKSLITELLPDELEGKFEYSESTSVTNDDEAGLAMIAELIDKKAEKKICVLGRGPQMIDPKTSHYVASVARAILRGVEYTRILLLDSSLPQNGLLWLLLLERFLKSPEWRNSVHLYVVKMGLTNLALQFQIIDEKFLHQVVRSYVRGEEGASRKAQSQFTMVPHHEVFQHCNVYESQLSESGDRYNHAQVVELLSEILHALDPKRQDITYHWKLVLEVNGFLEQLNVKNLPPRAIKFVGSLMPCTFTYQAAEKFVKSTNESETIRERLIVLPFRRFDDAITQFLEGRLDYICLPIENSAIDNLVPPTLNQSPYVSVEKNHRKIFEIALPLKFVLAGTFQQPVSWRRLVAVQPAYLQVRDALPENASQLLRYEEEIESNYHSAWLAQKDPNLVAVTTYDAAKHFNLCSYADLQPPEGKNSTKFAVYAH